MIHFFINTSAQTFTIGELAIELHHIFITSSSWLSDRSLTTYSNGYSLHSFNKLFINLYHKTLTTTLSQNFQNNLWYNSSLYIFQRTSVSFVNVRIVHTSYHKTLYQTTTNYETILYHKTFKTIFVSFTY